MNNYHGYGKFIVFKSDESGMYKYELLRSEITQFGHTVSSPEESIFLSNKEKLYQPHEWLTEYINESMPYELENFIDAYDFKMNVGEYAEVCGFLLVTDTSSDTPDGREYDSELSLEEPIFKIFKLEDLKESYYYNAFDIAEWMEYRDGLEEGEDIYGLYQKLVKEGYSKTNEDILKEEKEERKEYYKIMGIPGD